MLHPDVPQVPLLRHPAGELLVLLSEQVPQDMSRREERN
jgi:hypothetical protein